MNWKGIRKDLGIEATIAALGAALRAEVIPGDHAQQNSAAMEQNGTQVEYPKLLIAGPHRVGKSSTLDALEERYPTVFERGGKHKYRHLGGPWPDDNQKKDSLIVRTERELEQLRKSGKIAFEYDNGVDTINLVGRDDAERVDKRIVYISDSHNGAMAFRNHFRDAITFLFYTTTKTIEDRLIRAKIPEEQRIKRLQAFEGEFGLFRDHSADYLIPIFTPSIDRNIPLDPAAHEKRIKEIRATAERVVSLIEQVDKYFKQGVSYGRAHQAFIEEQVQKLTGYSLANLDSRLIDSPIKLQFAGLIEEYRKQRHIPQEALQRLKEVEIVKYVKAEDANGRHTILFKGLVPDGAELQFSPEDVLLDLIKMKLGEPTERRAVRGQSYLTRSDFGLFHVGNGGQQRHVKDGLVYSMGDPMVNNTHVSLTIGFLYQRGKQSSRIAVTGYSMADLQRFGLSVGGEQIRPY
ncbi:hypothetical protein HYV81_04120 [Candidatus Woesearchaeota archaeon]|nr:hypothetical protein [Candidatus Woesearchaeota archaeon]